LALKKKQRRKSPEKMPMLMLKCKTCGEVFAGVYVDDNHEKQGKIATASDHTCSRGHNNQYVGEDYMDWS
jgi:hypothetical protein